MKVETATFITICASCVVAIKGKEKNKKEHRIASYNRGLRNCFLRNIVRSKFRELDDRTFHAMFRMNRSSFELLIQSLGPFLEDKVNVKNKKARQQSNRRPLTVVEKVCVGIRIAAGASYADAVWGFEIGRTSVYRAFTAFVVAVIRSPIGPIFIPKTVQGLQGLADLMDSVGVKCHLFHGCIGAIDGYAIRINQPSSRETESPLSYRNRKGFCSINM